jgi:hypothetical protein
MTRYPSGVLTTTRDRFLAKIVAGPNGCAIWTAKTNERGYGRFHPERGHGVGAHRFAYELLIGPIPDGLQLDHVCHNRDTACPGGVVCLHRRCVNPWHLQPVSHAENVRRRDQKNSSRPTNNTSGFKGVSWRKDCSRWTAAVYRHGRKIHLGVFDTPEEAARAYEAATIRKGGRQ